MHHSIRLPLLGIVAGLAFGVAPAMADHHGGGHSNKWRIEVSEGSGSDGAIVFRVKPDGGVAQDVTVKVIKGRSENEVATDIRDSLKVALDQKKYQVEVDDGEDVLIKKLQGPEFSVELVQSSVEAVRVEIDKE